MNLPRPLLALIGGTAFALYLAYFLIAEALRFIFAPAAFRRDLASANAAPRHQFSLPVKTSAQGDRALRGYRASAAGGNSAGREPTFTLNHGPRY